jgi:hypothetical protein
MEVVVDNWSICGTFARMWFEPGLMYSSSKKLIPFCLVKLIAVRCHLSPIISQISSRDSLLVVTCEALCEQALRELSSSGMKIHRFNTVLLFFFFFFFQRDDMFPERVAHRQAVEKYILGVSKP